MEIGKSVLYYDENGKLETVEFVPSMSVKLTNEELARFAKIDGNSESEIENAANAALATWFQKTNEIELADRSEWKIVTTVQRCIRGTDNVIRRCELILSLKRINDEVDTNISA